MLGWWDSLGTPLQIFYALAIATSAVLTVQVVLILLGLDGAGEVDLDVHDAGGGILSVRTVTAFFTGFGWAGVAGLEAGWSLAPTLLLASVVGTAFMGGVFGLMRGLASLRYSGTLDYHNAIGNVGTVYLRIPPAMQGPGQIEVMVQGRLRVVQAFTRAEQVLANRSRVEVVDLMDETTLIVAPLDSAAATANAED